MKKIIYLLILGLLLLSGFNSSINNKDNIDNIDNEDISSLQENIVLENENGKIIESNENNENNENNKNSETTKTTTTFLQHNIMEVSSDNSIGDNITITRAMAAKMLALVHNTPSQITTFDKQISFTDVSEDFWYYDYINIVANSSLMIGDGENFNPEQPLTFNDANSLLSRLFPENNLSLNVNPDNMDSPISYALWCQLYNKTLEDASENSNILGEFSIVEKNITILATNGNNSKLNQYFMITDKGPMYYTGLYLDNFIDKSITVLCKDDEIISVKSFDTSEPILENCYVVSSNINSITLFTGGAERTYFYSSSSSYANENINENLTGNIVNFQIIDNTASNIIINNEIITGNINLVNSEKIEINTGNGSQSYELDKDAKIYSVSTGVPLWFSLKDLIIGSNVTDFILKDNKIVSAVIKNSITPENIRVVINNSNYQSLNHDIVTISSSENYIVDTGLEKIKVDANNTFTVSSSKNNDLMGQDRIYIYTENPNGKIKISSLKRNWENDESPMYRGTIEISKTENANGYYIVNELSFEEYLYAVVPSEMPSSYGLECLQVQAITARSYAYNQFFENKYSSYGANVDDSVLCQVYNNIPENNISIEAVNSTKGKCLTYEGSVVTANFFSTSSGYTANNGEVWANSVTGEFPAETLPYLSSVKQFAETNQIYNDLSNEETAMKFYKDMNIDSYDSEFSWFRWNVTMSMKELENSINNNLETRYNANKNLILTLSEDNTFKSFPIKTIGTLEKIEVVERSRSGNIMKIKITGSENTILVLTEYNIRILLKPFQYDNSENPIILNLKNNSTISNYSLLPSSFFSFELDETNQTVTFWGGGNGHGVGMSQNGVKAMVDKGFSPDNILTHYYPDCEISKIL